MPGNCYTEALPSRLKKYFVILFLLLTRGHFITASTAAVRTRGDFGSIPSPYDADFERKIRSKTAAKIYERSMRKSLACKLFLKLESFAT